jgi:hypothetical protein
MEFDPHLTIKAVLYKCLALRRSKSLTEEEVEQIKNIARGSMCRGEYLTWESLFGERLKQKQQQEPF